MQNDKYDIVSFAEFTAGCKAVGCDDLTKWKAFASGRAAQEIKDKAIMKKVYVYYFKPARDEGKIYINCTDNFEWYHSQFFTSKMLGVSIPKCNFYPKWIAFTNEWGSKNKTMVKDSWDCFWDITKDLNGDWSNWEEVNNDCWPAIFDDFDEFMKK